MTADQKTNEKEEHECECQPWWGIAIVLASVFMLVLQVRYHYHRENENKEWLMQIQKRLDDKTDEMQRVRDLDQRWRAFLNANPTLNKPDEPWPFR